MKTSTIVTIVVIVLVVLGLGWWLAQPKSALEPGPVEQGASAGATTSEAVPGDNLTLGQNSDAKLGNYVIGYNGMTLYTYAPDTDGTSHCTGACATAWPPYVVTSTDNLVAESPLSGTVGTLARADGTQQVTYNGHPLYFYAKDAQSGDTTGQGVGGVWFVVKP
jgi:predicted lipoprotein with Yx(FWY)xxD motif